MTSAESERIRKFALEPVPPAGHGDHWPQWKVRARNLGPEAPLVLLEILKEGRFDEQYASLLALREYGYEAWSTGHGKAETYEVRSPGAREIMIVLPLHPDDQGYRAADGQWIETPRPS